MTAKNQFMRRFADARERDGLTDMKFMVDGAHNLTEEQFFEQAIQFDDAAENAEEVDLTAIEDVPRLPSKLLS